jgi:Zn-dependent alcohol dehydrogenase
VSKKACVTPIGTCKMVNDEKVVRGTHFGSGRPHFDIPCYLELSGAGMMPVDRLKSDTFEFESLNMALDRLHSSGAVCQILLPGKTEDA